MVEVLSVALKLVITSSQGGREEYLLRSKLVLGRARSVCKHSRETMDASPFKRQFLPRGTRIEEFVIERILQSDGFVDTYLARDQALGRQVVIKECMPNEFCMRDSSSLMVLPRPGKEDAAENFRWLLGNFSREARTFAGLSHPGLVGVLRFFQANGTGYCVLPRVEGVSLDELVKQRGEKVFSEDELRGWLVRILEVLGYLHERNIQHWDIKLESILVTHEGLPLLGDFGAAWHWQGERSALVGDGAEDSLFQQFQTREALGAWCDFHSLGASLVMLITGKAAPQSYARSVGDSWVPLSGRVEVQGRYSKEFLEGIDKALRLPNEVCWQSAGEWLAAVPCDPFSKAAERKKTAEPVGRDGGLLEITRRHRWSWVAAVVVLLLGGVLAFLSLKPREVGGLVITSEPAGAELRDGSGTLVGKTPVELAELPVGWPWRGALALEGYLAEKVVSEVTARQTRPVPLVRLRPAPQQVKVTSDPPGAEVLEGGTVLGVTPWEGAAREAGSEVAMVLRLPGYQDGVVAGKVEVGSALLLELAMQPIAQKVRVTSLPAGAEVLFGGKVVGVTPLELPEVLPGVRVEYQIKLAGFRSRRVSGDVLVGKPLELAAKLEVENLRMFEGVQPGEEREFEIAPGVKITMCWIPPGEFMMGSSESELGRENSEKQVQVKLSKGFWLAKTEITQAQWKAGGGIDSSVRSPAIWAGEVQYTWENFNDGGIVAENFKGGDLPVERVDWNEVRAWCVGVTARLRKSAKLEASWRLVLPSEAQWEYACRAGTTAALHNGTDLTSNEGIDVNLNELGWYDKNSEKRTNPVGMKKANAWGLHDMHGNVWEWCSDWYGEELSGGVDPKGPEKGVRRASRGGSWGNDGSSCRSASRSRDMPDFKLLALGFRPALVASE